MLKLVQFASKPIMAVDGGHGSLGKGVVDAKVLKMEDQLPKCERDIEKCQKELDQDAVICMTGYMFKHMNTGRWPGGGPMARALGSPTHKRE